MANKILIAKMSNYISLIKAV